jgi:hypothetical protein
MVLASARWQRDVHLLVGLEPPGDGSPALIVLVTPLVALGSSVQGGCCSPRGAP